jgi:hypothetical protein
MAQPTAGDIYVNIPLTNVSLAYYQDQSSFIADKMFPVVPVQLQSSIIWEWDVNYILKNGMKPRAEGTESEGIGSKLNQKTYLCLVTALHKDISDQRRANELAPINADRNATTQLSAQAVQYREISLKASAFGTGKWTGMTDQAGVSGSPGANQFKQWDQPSSDPVADVTNFKQTILLATGVEPKRMAMGRQVWDKLKTNQAIIDRLKFFGVPGSPTIVTMNAVAALFGVEEVLVSSTVQQTSNEGAATAVNGFVIGKEFVLFNTPPAADIDTPSAGYTFAWQGYLGANAYGARMKKFRMEHLAADRIEIEQAYDQRLLSPALGGYASAVVA